MGELPRVHVITDDAILASPDFSARAEAVLDALGPDGALHIRGHATSGRRLYALAMALAPRASRVGALLVVNDRIDVALAVGGRAVQVGHRSFGVDDVRRIAPTLRVGESVHEASASRADWVIAGHVFHTPSHAREAARGLDFVREVTRRAGVPVIAIGGVKPNDVAALRDAGAYGVAVIRGIWHDVDNARAARDYLLGFG
jgi:thiamine-phosphate diphosphorylase